MRLILYFDELYVDTLNTEQRIIRIITNNDRGLEKNALENKRKYYDIKAN